MTVRAVPARIGLWREVRPRTLLALALVALVEAICAAALSTKPMMVAGAVAAFGLAALAAIRPPAVAVVAMLLLVLVPVYAAPTMGPIVLYPPVCALWLVALASLATVIGRRQRLPGSAIDVAFGALMLSMAMSTVVGGRMKTEFATDAFVWVGCYMGPRLLLAYTKGPQWLIRTFVLAALTVLPFVLYETLTQDNPFFSFAYNAKESEIWAVPQDRFGTQRVEASFGHAIALGMFLATAALFCLGMALNRTARIQRAAWLCGAGLFAVAITPTVSRTGWVVLGIGIAMLAIGTADRMGLRWLAGLVATVTAVSIVLAVALPNESVSPSAFDTGGSAARANELRGSDRQRQLLLQNALTEGGVSLFGTRESRLTANIAGNTSVDNAYLVMADSWGAVPMFALIAMVTLAAAALVRARRHGLWAVPAAVAMANLIGLLFVALITQQMFYVIALVGATAAFDGRLLAERPARAHWWRLSGRQPPRPGGLVARSASG